MVQYTLTTIHTFMCVSCFCVLAILKCIHFDEVIGFEEWTIGMTSTLNGYVFVIISETRDTLTYRGTVHTP